MRAPFCRYLKLLNATHIRKVACVAGGTVMPRVLSWWRRPRGIWLVPNIYAAQPPKNYNSRPLIPPVTQAVGKLHGKERSRSKDLRSNLGIYLETFLPCSLIGRNKEGFRHHQEPARTSGRKKVCRIPRWDASCDYVLCRLPCSPEKTVPVKPLRPLRHLYSMVNSIQETQNLPSWTNVHKIFVFGTSIHRTFALVPRVSPEKLGQGYEFV